MGGFAGQKGQGVAITVTNEILVTGSTGGFFLPKKDVFLLKFSPEGQLQWNITWGANGGDEGRGLVLDSTGNIFVGAKADSSKNYMDMALLKFSAEGELLWNISWGGGNIDTPYGVVLDSHEQPVMAGESYPMDRRPLMLLSASSPLKESYSGTPLGQLIMQMWHMQ
ncbi:MAG: hypothetical protein GF308_08815 [Candidatus Heimdallarchaeota archaeon]|nr:hypothetical protein [Candidatus Heimdallarchaeota archaeon]